MLKARVLTAAIALPILLAAIELLPDFYFSVLVAALGLVALSEIGAMTASGRIYNWLIIAVAGAIPMLMLLFSPARIHSAAPAVLMGIVMANLSVLVSIRGAQRVPKGAALALIGAAYVGVLFPYFAFVRNSLDGCDRLLLMLALVIVSDTAAYFGGRAIGRHKLALALSPNKTVEGALVGFLATTALAVPLASLLEPAWRGGAAAGYGAAISVLAQAGDLAGSALKRSAGVKDSGWIFPGHGGMIDRSCSLVFAAAFTYYRLLS